MACLSNTPSFTYVSVQNMVINYKNIYYSIRNMYSNDKYFYWDKNESPYNLITSNKILESKEGLYLILVNNKGTFILPNQSDIVINFDNNGAESSGHLTDLVSKVDDITKKYVNISETIDGIIKVVGRINTDFNENYEAYSEMKQTVERIELLTQKISQEYSKDNQKNELREKIIAYAISLNTLLNNFIEKMRTTFSDNLITADEDLEIINELNIIEQEKNEFFICINELIDILLVNKENEHANLLKSQKELFDSSFINFKNILYSCISDDVVTPTEIATLIGLATSCITSLNNLKESCNDFLFIGIGGTIYEEISRLNIEKNNIVLGLRSISTTLKSSMNFEMSSLQAQYEDVVAKLNLLKDWITESSKDGTITLIERNILKQRTDDLSVENGQLIEKYNQYLETLILDDQIISDMKKQYLNYTSNFITLNNVLAQISEDDYFNESERNRIITILEEFRISLDDFFNLLNKSLATAEQNRYEQEIEGAKGELNVQIQDVENKISELDGVVSDTFLDNVIDEIERSQIENTMDSLRLQYNAIVNQYNSIIEKESMKDTTLQIRIDLDENYNDFVADYNSIEDKVTEILNKTALVTNEDKQVMDTLYNELLNSVSNYTSSANNALIYISENEAKVVQDNFSKEITSVNQRIDNLEIGYDDTFADNIIDEAERKDIILKQIFLKREHEDILAQYNTLSQSEYITTNAKENLTTAYNDYKSAYDELNSAIALILVKPTLIDDDDRLAIDNGVDNLENKLSAFTSVANDTIEIISQEQTIKQTEEINNKVTKLEQDFSTMETDIKEAISDSIIDENEKNILRENIKNLEIVKVELDNEYNEVSVNPNLSVSALNKYTEAYNVYVENHNTYINKINELINTEGDITEEQITEYNNTYNVYKASVDDLVVAYQLAMSNITNNIYEDMKASLNKETRELKTALNDLDKSMEDVFNDSYLTDAEKDNIRQKLDAFKEKKESITQKYEYVVANLQGNDKASLTSSYNNYISKFDALCTAVEGILARTDMLALEDRLMLDGYINDHNNALTEYSLIYNDMVVIATDNFVRNTKNDLEESLKATNTTIADLEENLNGVFRDGVLTDAEKTSIKQVLQQLQVEKADIDSDYFSLYNNKDLVDTDEGVGAKTNLKNAYDEYCAIHTSLVDVIDELINSTDIIDDSDRNTLDMAFSEYKEKLGVYRQRVNEAVDSIANKKINDEKNERITQYNEISQTNEALTLKVGTIEEDLTNLRSTTNESFLELTDEKIISKVSSAKNENDKDLFTKTSTLEQTVEDITMKFTDINNKLENNITVISNEGITVKMYNETDFDEEGVIVDGAQAVALTKIDGRGLYIYKEENNEPIAYFTDTGCYVANLYAENLKNGEFIRNTANTNLPKTWYVSPTETGDGSGKDSSNKSSSITNVLNEIKTQYGHYLNGQSITIRIEEGVYNEIVDVIGFLGTGELTLNFSENAVLHGCINIEDNTIRTILDGGGSADDTSGAVIFSYESKSQNAINVRNSYCSIEGFKAKNVSVEGNTYYGCFASFVHGAEGFVRNCDFIYYEIGIGSSHSSQVGTMNIRGSVEYRRRSAYGGIIVSNEMLPRSTTSSDSIVAGVIHQVGTLAETGSTNWYGDTDDGESSQTQTLTQTFTLINLKSVPEGSGNSTSSRSGLMAQGKYSNNKKHRGKGTLPDDVVAFLESARSIESISLSCHRLNTNHGQSTAVPYPHMRMVNTSTNVASDYFADSSVKFARGDTKTINVTSDSIKSALLNGAKELQFFVDDNENPQAQYSHYDNVKMTITITK